jgi:2-oxoglutarate/2-oxoacid ferredoxin oxidoreductase subunit alpha
LDLTIRIAGEAGQGMQTIGTVVCRICKEQNIPVFAHQDYMSRIRGGNNFFQIRISDTPAFAPREKINVLLALNKESVLLHRSMLAERAVVVFDKTAFGKDEDDVRFFDVPLNSLAGETRFVNSVALGVLTGLLRFDFKIVEKMVEKQFKRKGNEIVEKNVSAARAGHATALDRFRSDALKAENVPGKGPVALLLNGNDAIALGAVQAGCKFYSGYPMTPSTEIMENIARFSGDYGIVVEQAEDEIAAVNMCIGASFAGVRAMTATSGGGFALMTEGVSLAAMTETPLVIVVAQRPAPATGFPTRTEQADLDFVIHGGHGEFAKAVFAPGTAEEAFKLTVKAFDLAEMFQIPVFIMTDQYLADSYRTVPADAFEGGPNKRHILSRRVSENINDYRRYALTPTGISPRAVPSWINDPVYADSDEHDETGHITEDAKIRTAMVDKRFSIKKAGLTQEVVPPTAANLEGAETILCGFGSTYGVMKEISAVSSNKRVGFIHLPQVWPFPSAQVAALLENRSNAKVLTIENNAGGQLKKLLRRETGLDANGSILRYDGRPFTADGVMSQLSEKA